MDKKLTLRDVEAWLQRAEIYASAAEASAYPKQRCIDAILEVARDIGGPPTAAAYERYRRPEHPSLGTVVARFRSWNAALEAAGLRRNRIGERRGPSREQMLRIVAENWIRCGGSLSRRKWPKGSPSRERIIQYFGSLRAAVRAAYEEGIFDELLGANSDEVDNGNNDVV